MKTNQVIVATFLAAATLMGGCANTNQPMTSSTSSYTGVVYGVVDAIETSQGSSGSSDIGAGTVIGGVVGGLLGSQVGGGHGKDAATVAGVVGGAVVGHEIEKNRQQQSTYRVRVRLNNGGYEDVTQQDIADLRVGDRVRIENNRVSRY
jgi:outer membrane lipoprotein SlyB